MPSTTKFTQTWEPAFLWNRLSSKPQLTGEQTHKLVRTSVVTPKPANGGQGKTGQREEAGDSVVLSCRLLWWQVYFRTPTPGTTFEYMPMMEKTIEHGGNGGAISQ